MAELTPEVLAELERLASLPDLAAAWPTISRHLPSLIAAARERDEAKEAMLSMVQERHEVRKALEATLAEVRVLQVSCRGVM